MSARTGSATMARLYRIGLAIDTILLLMAAANALMMWTVSMGDADFPADRDAGLTAIGRLASWGIPLVLLVLVGTAVALQARGALVAANVLLWLPALPFGLMLVPWFAVAIAFVLSAFR